jgi:hypothetical protein
MLPYRGVTCVIRCSSLHTLRAWGSDSQAVTIGSAVTHSPVARVVTWRRRVPSCSALPEHLELVEGLE